MKIDLIDINKFIERNKCQEITNSIMFNFGSVATSDGIFSQEIFGSMGSDKRKETFAYIDLHGKFLHPLVYIILTTMNRKLIQCISGTKYFKVTPKGEIVEDSNNGETGLAFLYDNWEKFRWKTTESYTRDDKVYILEKYPKDILFVDKWLVIPPYTRDFQPVATGERIDKVEDINNMYANLIRACQNNDGFSFGFLANGNNFTIQTQLNEIYDQCTKQLARKTGLIHQALLGKSVDYSTRSVISCPRVNSDSYKNTEVKFGYTGVPLTQVINLFYPFFVYEIQAWMEQKMDTFEEYFKEKGYEVKNFMDYFDEDHIKKMMSSYIKNHEARFEPLSYTDKNGKIFHLDIYSKELKRSFTLTDLFYIVGVNVVQNKHVYITRYPITNFMNIFPSRIHILTTQKTCKMMLGNDYYQDYPLLLPNYPLKSEEGHTIFVDTVRLHDNYLSALNADFDGDTISLRGVYTQEANAEAEEIMHSKSYIVGSGNKNERTIKNECVQSIYSFTY